jgi:Tfp pilus assembly protein PilF
MTLNLLAATPTDVYMSCDFRLVDLASGRPIDNNAHKLVTFQLEHSWGLIAVTGVAALGGRSIGEWIAVQVTSLPVRSTIDDLLGALAASNPLLSTIPLKHRRHTFTVGAIAGGRSIVAMVSNFQGLDTPEVSASAETELRITVQRPRSPRVFVAGAVDAVLPKERESLERLLRSRVSEERVLAELQEVNEKAASRGTMVSRGSYVASVSASGKGRARPSLTSEQEGDFIPPEIAELLKRTGIEIQRALDPSGNPMPLRVVEYLPTRFPLATDASFERELRREPENAELWNNYGVFLHRRGDLAKAEVAFRRALEIAPEDPAARQNLAGLLAGMPDRSLEARAAYEELLMRADTPASMRSAYAVFLERSGDAEGAEQQHRRAAESDDWPTAKARYATFLWRHRGEYDRAAELYAQALASDGVDAESLLSAAQFEWQATADLDAADDLFCRALALDQDNEWGLRNYADFLVDRRADARTALGFYRRALRKAKPPTAELVGNYGFALLMAGGRPERALRHLRKANEIEPASVNARINLTLGLFLAGRAESAAAELDGLLRRNDLAPDQVFELQILRALFDSSAASREDSAAHVKARLTEAGDIIPESVMRVLTRHCSSRTQRVLLDQWDRWSSRPGTGRSARD